MTFPSPLSRSDSPMRHWVAAVAACSLFVASPALAAAAPFVHARSAAEARPVADAAATLQGFGGTPTTLAAYRGRWVWLYFGFANCPGICPFAMDYLADAYGHLQRPEDVQVLFVSVDPVRDTPSSLEAFAKSFNPRFQAATGARAALDALTRSVGASYELPANAAPGVEYAVGHPNRIYVIDPSGRLAAVYEPDALAKVPPIAADFNALTPQAAVAPTAEGPPAFATPATGAAWCGAMPEGATAADEALMARAASLGSGTAVIPASSPMRMLSLTAGDWLWMFHGDAVAGYNVQGGPRGDLAWAAENWQMAMGSRYWGPGILDLRLMTSLEAFTLPPGGTPQLFQSGETYRNQPLIDKQHPHDMLMELAGRYTWNLDDRTGLFAYGGLVGEPALGPSAFMHRPSATDNHWAPLGHHWQDATHIAHGVATLGARRDAFQLEGSVFNGKEPDEDRVALDFGPLNSYSTRLSWFPGRNWALQASFGHLVQPEALHYGDVDRLSASATNVWPFPWGWWSSTLVWGQNRELDFLGRSELDFVSQSYGLESQVDVGVHHAYGRYEIVDKHGLPPAAPLAHVLQRVNALTLGYVRDLVTTESLALGLGADATAYSLDSSLWATYGQNPVSFRVYLRLRPSTMGRPGALPANP